MDGWTDGWTHGCMDGQTDGWMDGWMDGYNHIWMVGWMYDLNDGGSKYKIIALFLPVLSVSDFAVGCKELLSDRIMEADSEVEKAADRYHSELLSSRPGLDHRVNVDHHIRDLLHLQKEK